MSWAVIDAISVECEEEGCGCLLGVACHEGVERWIERGRGWQYVLDWVSAVMG